MIFSSNYFPCVYYFSAILNQTEVKINILEQYRKQSYKTRAYILGPHKIETLNVPVCKSPNNAPIKDIKIDYSENWQKIQWKTIETCYKKSPFFEYYDYLIKPIFDNKYENLIDLNQATVSVCLKILKVQKTICQEEFSFLDNKSEFIAFDAKNRHQDLEIFNTEPYYQNFGKIFEPNLSILDLLFCKGNESAEILKKTWKLN